MTTLSVLMAIIGSVGIALICPRKKDGFYRFFAFAFSAIAVALGFNVEKFVNFYGAVACIIFLVVFVLFAAGLFRIMTIVAKKVRK